MSQLQKIVNDKINKDLMQYIDISKGKIITLLKTVFSFLNDNSLLKGDSETSFEKYLIDNKFIQTMSKVFYFYSSNYPENGKIALNELIKERYSKYLKYFEQNLNFFSNSKELQFRYYQIQGLILLWLLETKFDTEYYDDFIRLINSLIRLDKENNINGNINIDNKYLKKFLVMILKFPFIKQNKETVINALIVNECNDSIINYFNENLDNIIQKKNLIFKPDINEKPSINIGKKSIQTNKDSNFPLFKDSSPNHSNKRKSFSNTSSQKGLLSIINSSGFYTPEFKHNKRDMIRNFRRFTINNINNPKTSIISKNQKYSRANSMSDGMNNLLIKCEQGKHTNPKNSINNNNEISTKTKLRLAVQGHFYSDDDYKNNIDLENTSNFSLNNENIYNNNINNNDICQNDICDEENEIENNIVSVDELPINPNLSMLSNSTSKNIGVEPENIIQESREEEEIDENDEINKKNNSIPCNDNYFKILTQNEISDFFNQQFSDNKNKNKEENNRNIVNNIKNNNENKKKKENKNNKKRNNSKSSSNSSSRNNSLNNNLINNNKRSDFINKEKQNSKKNISFNSNIFKDKEKKNTSKENNKISAQEKMKIYSNKNIFGMIKNHKNKKEVGLKNKVENVILQPCTKGKELMNNVLNHHNGNENKISKEKLPTDSVAKRNLLSLYNQLKTKK